MEAIIPIEIRMPTLQTEILEKANVEAITRDLDMIDELHEATTSIIPIMTRKLIQQTCKVACVPTQRPKLKKGL